MRIFISIIVSAATLLLTYICLNKELFYRVRILSGSVEVDEEYSLSRRTVCVLAGAAAIIAFATSLKMFSIIFDSINITKMEIILLCLAGSMCVDIREHRIPNFFPAVLAVSGLALLALGAITGQEGAIAYITSGVVSCAATALLLLAMRLITKNGIGLGDVKLMAALALIGGVYTSCGTFFFAICACAVTAIPMLLLKKQKMSGSLPFGPFLFIGFVVSIFTAVV